MSRSVGSLGRDTDLRTFGNTAAAHALRAGSRMPAPNPVAPHLPEPERELAGWASLLSRLRELLSEGHGRAARHRASELSIASPWTHSVTSALQLAARVRQRPSIGGRSCTFHARTLVHTASITRTALCCRACGPRSSSP